MTVVNLKQKKTPDKQKPAAKVTDNQDTRYDYLMLLTNDWIASQHHSNDFIRSIN